VQAKHPPLRPRPTRGFGSLPAIALGIAVTTRSRRVSEDTAIGIFFSGAFALGIVLISRSRGYQRDLSSFLVGDVLSATQSDIVLGALVGGLVLLALFAFHKELQLVAFDPTSAAAMGYPVFGLELWLLMLITLTIITSISAVGTILVLAMLITPAATARLLTERFASLLVLGGLLGAVESAAGLYVSWHANVAAGGAIVLVATAGFFLALLLVLAVSWGFVRSSPSAVDNTFRSLQFISAALYSLGHGGNDAQKTMGIIAVLLYSQGMLGETFYIPFWVILSCQAAMGLGTLVGGWRIVRTMGSRITRLHPVQGFCAEAGGAITLFLVTYFGIPVSTTHTITGAIVGVGAARKTAAVRWNVASDVVVAWIVTLPAAALFGAAFYELYKFLS